MDFQAEQKGEDLFVTVAEPRIDAAGAIQFKDKMRELSQPIDGRIVLDMGSVEFVDSSGLGAIVAAMKQLKPGQKLELAALTDTVAKVFRLTRMDSIFPIHESIDSAMNPGAQAI